MRGVERALLIIFTIQAAAGVAHAADDDNDPCEVVLPDQAAKDKCKPGVAACANIVAALWQLEELSKAYEDRGCKENEKIPEPSAATKNANEQAKTEAEQRRQAWQAARDACEEATKAISDYEAVDKLWESAPMCQKVRLLEVDDLRIPLGYRKEVSAVRDAEIARVFDESDCGAADVVCLDRLGRLLESAVLADRQPEDLRDGDELNVIVFSDGAFEKEKALTELSLSEEKRRDTLARTDATTKKLVGAGAKSASQVYTLSIVHSATSRAVASDTENLKITFSREKPQVRRSYLIAVEHGKFYVDFGLAVPFVVNGTRTVTAAGVISEKTEPRAALSAIVFIHGRAKGTLAYGFWRSLGIQIATDFDFTKDPREKDYYLGLAWEPIAGFGLGLGLAAVKGEFISDLSTGAIGTDGASPAHNDRYMLRGYLSVFLTTEFIDAARAASTALHDSK